MEANGKRQMANGRKTRRAPRDAFGYFQLVLCLWRQGESGGARSSVYYFSLLPEDIYLRIKSRFQLFIVYVCSLKLDQPNAG